MDFRLLGPLEVVSARGPVSLGGPKQRAVLAMLLLEANRVVSVERLIEGIWGESPADGAPATLQVYISSLRKVLESTKGQHRVLVSQRPGYVLRVDPERIDALRFEQMVTAARKDLADERFESAARGLSDAMKLWRGAPLADFAFQDFAAVDIARLDGARIAALEDRIEAELACGRHASLVVELEGLVTEHPLRERLWGQLMLALYRSGCQADSLGTFSRARELLAEEFGVDPGPELRDLERRVLSQDPDLAPPPGSARLSVKLPLPPSPVVGRDDEITAVSTLLRRPGVRLVTLSGPGGTGKTSLALEVAAGLVNELPGGVFFVPLAEIDDPEQVLPAIAAVLEVSESVDEPLLETIVLSLGGQETLLVLDNFEQVVGSATAVSELLSRAPSLQVLVTSRALMHLRGEHEFPVPGLALPGPGNQSPEQALDSAAIAMFVDRMVEVRPDFALDVANTPTITEICTRLDGLPLAIELAVARGRLMEPAALLALLDQQLRVLTSGARDLPGRQQTMRGAIDWSYNLLDPAEQRLFAVLGSMAGEFTLEAVAAAAGGDPSDPDVLDGLGALVDNSMVRQLPRADGTRFRMLEPMREYASERLGESGTEDSVRRLLLDHLLTQLEAIQSELDGPDASRLLSRVETDYANLRAALAWALDADLVQLAARMTVALGGYWFSTGRLTEGREWLGRVLAAGPAPARVHLTAGSFAYFQDDGPAARLHLEEALELARGDVDDETIADSLAYLGAVLLGTGDVDGAAGMAEEALDLSRSADSYEAQTLALSLSAVLAAAGEDLGREMALYLERLELVRTKGDRRRIAETLNNLAELALATDRVDEARTYASEALELGRNVTKTVTRDVLVSLARIAVADEDPATSTDRIVEALQLSVELGQQFEISQCLLVFAGLAALRNEQPRAAQLYGCAARLRGETSPLDVELEPDIAAQRNRVREAMGETAFMVAQAHGSAMSVEDVVSSAFADARLGYLPPTR